MSKMLNQFVKIIEQVDPEEMKNQHEREQQRQHDEFDHDDENHQNQHSSIDVSDENNDSNERRNNSNSSSNKNQQQEHEEITDYDISDPFVAEYNHSRKKSERKDDENGNDRNTNEDEQNHYAAQQLAFSPIDSNNNNNSNFNNNSDYSNDQQRQLMLDSSSHYLNYLNNTGSFDLQNAVASSDVKALLERIAALETAITQSNYERQVLQCRLEKKRQEELVEKTGERHVDDSSSVNNRDTQQQHLRQLRESLVEQIEKNDALAREFQGRVVQLEYELVNSKRNQRETQEDNDRLKNDLAVASSSNRADDNEGGMSIDGRQQQGVSIITIDESKKQQERIRQLELKLHDSQRKNDLMQKKAADALEKATSKEKLLENELELAQREINATRKQLLEAQRPIDHQLEDQLQKTPVFEKINHTQWGLFVTNLMGSIDRIGVNTGRFFAAHAMIRFFFVVYVICLHVYIFHLFTAVLHHMETTGNDVHDHLEKFHHQHGAAKP